MKVIVAGATGLVGSAVVRQCISNEKITHAFVLTRKPLPEAITASPKLTVITHDDFASYPADLLGKLAGAEACIWSIGGRVRQFPDVETCRKVHVEYTLAAANAFLSALAPQLPHGEKFRFVFCSGKYSEWDQEKSVAFLADSRRIKGLVEKALCDLADANKDQLEVWLPRPSGILSPDAGTFSKVVGNLYSAIGSDHLALGLVKIALEGYPERIIECDALLRMH